MSLLWWVVAAGLAAWLLLLLHVCARKATRIMHEDVTINPKVNFGRVASVHSIQGQRSHMEDAYYGDYTKGFFAVYDGHGGARCSSYAAQNLHSLVFRHDYSSHPQLALQEGFRDLDSQWLDLARLNGWDDGSTAVSALIVNKTLYVANVGDSRAVLCSSGGRARDMSADHKPAREDEKARIEKLGGRIIHYGTWRVQGVLAVTRAFGDRRLKAYVTAEPEIKACQLQEGDDFLILASDGVWDVLSSQAACDIVRQAVADSGGKTAAASATASPSSSSMTNGSSSDRSSDSGDMEEGNSPTPNGVNGSPYGGGMVGGDVRDAARRLTNAAYSYHSMDNITSLVIDLRGFR